MPSKVDTYIEEVIAKGDEGSELLARICAPTLKNCKYIDVVREGMNGLAVLRLPPRHVAVVHSAGGDPRKGKLEKHAASLVDRLVKQAEKIGARPLAFADVIDSSTGNTNVLETIANALVEEADARGLAIMNGENAILGPRVYGFANVSGTMISMLNWSQWKELSHSFLRDYKAPTIINLEGSYGIFNPKGKPILIGSDGIGTKTEFYERAREHELGIWDFMAMTLDDTSKFGAIAKVISGVCETKGNIPVRRIKDTLEMVADKMGILGILEHEPIGGRLRGYNDKAASYNVSGSVVSVIDEERLKKPLRPRAGEYVIAIRGKPNPRSNGITDKRETMVRLFGKDYHKTKEGRLFLKYLAEPSTVLYPVFKRLIDNGLATSVYHMSGGAYNGKFAKPLAKHDLFVRLEGLFEPDWRELALAGADFTSVETAYAKWPMGNDGFITTKDPDKAMKAIRRFGLEAGVVGRLNKPASGIRGVGLEAFNGETVYYSGNN